MLKKPSDGLLMMARLVIFDFDDTLLILGINWGAVRGEVASLARKSGLETDRNEHLVPLGNRLSADPALKSAIDEIYLKFEMACADDGRYTVVPEMVGLVKELRSQGARLAIASGNHTESIRAILRKIGLESDFDFVCGRDSTERGKPAPDQLELIMKTLGIGKADTIFIGDSIYDQNAAKAAGLGFFRLEKGTKKDIAGLRRALGL